MSSKRQNKSNPGRVNRPFNSMPKMCHALTALVGAKCEVRVRNADNIYEGYFHCFSPTMDLIVSAAHKVNKEGGDGPLKNEIVDDIIFPAEEVVTFTFDNVDLNYATDESFTDSAISSKEQCKIDTDEKYNNLVTWTPGPNDKPLGDDIECEIAGPGTKQTGNGWAADEMFNVNTTKFDIQTSYDRSLTGYTVDLDKENTTDGQRSRANKLAAEIESSANYQKNINRELDETMDEEAKFSAVERPNDKDGAAAAAAAAAAGGDQSNVDSSGKYVPPSRRGGEQQKPPHHARQASNPSNPPNSQNPQNRTQSRDQRNNNVPVPNNEKKQTPNNDRAQYSNKPTTPPRKEPVESRPRKGSERENGPNQPSRRSARASPAPVDDRKEQSPRTHPANRHPANNSHNQNAPNMRGGMPPVPAHNRQNQQPNRPQTSWSAVTAGMRNSPNKPTGPNVTGVHVVSQKPGKGIKGEEIASLRDFQRDFHLKKNDKPDPDSKQPTKQPPSNPRNEKGARRPSPSPKNVPSPVPQPVQQAAALVTPTQPPPPINQNRAQTPQPVIPQSVTPQPTPQQPVTPQKIDKSHSETKKGPNPNINIAQSNLNVDAKEWTPNVNATEFTPKFTPKPQGTPQPGQIPGQMNPSVTPVMPQSPPANAGDPNAARPAIPPSPAGPQFIHPQQPIYPTYTYPVNQGQQFVQVPAQQMMVQGAPVAYQSQHPGMQPGHPQQQHQQGQQQNQQQNQQNQKPRRPDPSRVRHPQHPPHTSPQHNALQGPPLVTGSGMMTNIQGYPMHQHPVIYQPEAMYGQMQGGVGQIRPNYDQQFAYQQPMVRAPDPINGFYVDARLSLKKEPKSRRKDDPMVVELDQESILYYKPTMLEHDGWRSCKAIQHPQSASTPTSQQQGGGVVYHQGNPHQQGPMNHPIPHVGHPGVPVIQYSMATGAPNQGPMGHIQPHPGMHYQHARQPMPPQGQVGQQYQSQVQSQGQQAQQHG